MLLNIWIFIAFFVITETWLTDNVSDQKLVGDVTSAGYSFHHAARIYKKGGRVGICAFRLCLLKITN